MLPRLGESLKVMRRAGEERRARVRLKSEIRRGSQVRGRWLRARRMNQVGKTGKHARHLGWWSARLQFSS